MSGRCGSWTGLATGEARHCLTVRTSNWTSLSSPRSCEIAPAHVVGHSSGAIVALLVAAQVPDRVRSITVVEPPSYRFLDDPEVQRFADAGVALWDETALSDGDWLVRFFEAYGEDPRPPRSSLSSDPMFRRSGASCAGRGTSRSPSTRCGRLRFRPSSYLVATIPHSSASTTRSDKRSLVVESSSRVPVTKSRQLAVRSTTSSHRSGPTSRPARRHNCQ